MKPAVVRATRAVGSEEVVVYVTSRLPCGRRAVYHHPEGAASMSVRSSRSGCEESMSGVLKTM